MTVSDFYFTEAIDYWSFITEVRLAKSNKEDIIRILSVILFVLSF